jgi:O-antigen/teichoic acid export membrane protein
VSSARSALRSVLLYGSSIALVSASNFASVPILLALLGETEFGIWALIEPALMASIPLAGLGIQIGLLRLINGGTSDQATVAALLPVHAALALCVGLSVAVVTWFLEFEAYMCALLGAAVALEGTISFFSSLWRAQGKPSRFALVEGGRATILVAVLACLLMFGAHFGTVDTYFELRVGMALLALVAAIAVVRPHLRPSIPAAWSAGRYGVPIVVASALSALLIGADRYAVAFYEPEAISTYVAHMKLAQLVALVATAYFTWFGPIAIRHVNDEVRGSSALLVNSTSVFFLVLLIVCANLFLVAQPAWSLLFPQVAFNQQLLAVHLAGTALFAMGNPLSIGTLRAGHTYQAVIVALVAIAVGLASSFVLAGNFGVLGAAWGRMIGLAAYGFVFAVLTLRSLPLSYPWSTYAIATAMCILAASGVTIILPGDGWYAASARIAIANVLLVPIFGYLILAFTRKSERTQ